MTLWDDFATMSFPVGVAAETDRVILLGFAESPSNGGGLYVVLESRVGRAVPRELSDLGYDWTRWFPRSCLPWHTTAAPGRHPRLGARAAVQRLAESGRP